MVLTLFDRLDIFLGVIFTYFFLIGFTCYQAFPEALFHQLLVAMVCSDYETRLGAHRIFSIVLVPSSVCPLSSSATTSTQNPDVQRTLSRTVSVFSSSAALFGKLGNDRSSTQGTQFKPSVGKIAEDENASSSGNSVLNRLKSTYSRVSSKRYSAPPSVDEQTETDSNAPVVFISVPSDFCLKVYILFGVYCV